jgi:L-alanine-DL-glutamate epimerase-like enolase superfamily enzyme
MALWDLKGKVLGQPVAKLLGGQLKDAIPAMASIIFDMDDLDWTLNEFRGFVDEGYRIGKAGWGMQPDSLFGEDGRRDVRYVREIREAVGEDMSLVVDVPGARGLWDVPTAIRRFKELEEFDLRWIEQPLLPGDLKGHARLRAAVCTPVGTGEDEWSPESYQHVIESEGVDVLQLDPGRCLGLTGCREVVKMTEAAGLKYSAHSWSGALNTAASLAFLAISESGDALDLKPHESPLQHELVEDPWVQEGGLLYLRDEPGLGVTVREEIVDKYSFG